MASSGSFSSGHGPELLPRRAAAVRADLGARAAERPQHVQRAALDRRARLYAAVSGLLQAALGRSDLELAAALLALPLSAVFLVWSGWVLSAKRIERQDLLPFGIVGSALLAVYSVGAAVYVPHLFSTYATRYGVIGAVFAMISALFCVMLVVVGSAAAGREVRDELDRIRRGERPAEDEVRRQWDQVIGDARSRWDTLRAQIQERRQRPRRATIVSRDAAGEMAGITASGSNYGSLSFLLSEGRTMSTNAADRPAPRHDLVVAVRAVRRRDPWCGPVLRRLTA